MNIREKITAAAGSMTLNVALVLALGQGAGAATPAAHGWGEQPSHVVVQEASDRDTAQEHCRSRAHTRAIVALILGMIV